MFIWKVEDMVLLNQKGGIFLGKEKIYDCESKVSREDKIAFVDSMQDEKLSYILQLVEKFESDKENLPKDYWGYVKTVSLKAWIKRNDTKYDRPLLDMTYHYGFYNLLGCERNIGNNHKGTYDTYEDLVDEIFHRQLKECEKAEKKYFLEHDEYSILKQNLRDMSDKHRTTFGVSIGFCSDGSIFVYDDENHKNKRDITIDELKELLNKYEQLEKFIQKLTDETNIQY